MDEFDEWTGDDPYPVCKEYHGPEHQHAAPRKRPIEISADDACDEAVALAKYQYAQRRRDALIRRRGQDRGVGYEGLCRWQLSGRP